MKSVQKSSVPENTKKQTNWAVNIWKEWSDNRRKLNVYDCPSHIYILATNPWEFN